MSEAVTAKERDSGALVVSQVYDGILRLTLNNPPANALSMALLEALKSSLDKAGEDKQVRVVIIAAAGKLFSAGHDLKELTSHRQDADRGRAFFEKTMRLCAEVMMTITNLPKPVIAEIDGVATAAGCQLVATCHLHRQFDLRHAGREYRTFLFDADGCPVTHCASQAGHGNAFDR